MTLTSFTFSDVCCLILACPLWLLVEIDSSSHHPLSSSSSLIVVHPINTIISTTTLIPPHPNPPPPTLSPPTTPPPPTNITPPPHQHHPPHHHHHPQHPPLQADVRDMVVSLLMKARAGGWLPIFPAWHSYTDEMIGLSSCPHVPQHIRIPPDTATLTR